MKLVEPLYNWLATLDDSEADHILTAGLEHADPPYAVKIVATLLGRKTETAWMGLIANYDRLDQPTRLQVLAAGEILLGAGVETALQSPAQRHRQNALTLLADHPQPQLARLVSGAMRDAVPAVREVAAKILRTSAETMAGDVTVSADVRASVIAALGEALHSFDVHFRLEILEAGLWFAQELRETLWKVLGTRRSHAAYAVAEQLPAWDDPRLAGFLLIALSWPSWRWTVQEMLDRWDTRAQLLAILANSNLLADPQVRSTLHLLKAPAWLAAAGADLGELEPSQRALVPQWLCALGFGDEERVQILGRWRMSRYPEVQRAAVYALASLDSREALRILADVAIRPGPMMVFARWVLAGRRAAAVAGPVAASATAVPARTSPTEVDTWASS